VLSRRRTNVSGRAVRQKFSRGTQNAKFQIFKTRQTQNAKNG